MARTKLEISKQDFQKVVTDLEATNTFENPSLLWKAVEGSVWAKSLQPRPMTASVAYMRAKELGIVYNTKPGKKGGGNPHLGTMQRGPRVKRSVKIKKFKSSFDIMRQEVPERFKHLVDKLEKGSKTAALKLKCLDCSNFEPKEIKLCTCPGCSLFPYRPYQGKDENEGQDS